MVQYFRIFPFFVIFVKLRMPIICSVAVVISDDQPSERNACSAGNNEKLKMLNMGQHILDSLDTPQQLYQVCNTCVC